MKTAISDLLEGLMAPEKWIHPKFLYDARGSELFEEICTLEEYYPTRVETALLHEHRAAILEHVPADAAFIELGSGSSAKTRILLDAWRGAGPYVPIDISESMLFESAKRLRLRYPQLRVLPVCADYTNALALPITLERHNRFCFFPGSTIGNFDPSDASRFLATLRPLLSAGAGYLLVGVDLVKDRETLERAYDDARGVTAEFNLNLLRRLNHEYGAHFARDDFSHRATWNAAASRVEMHLDCWRDHSVTIAGKRISFRAGESIHTESSYKYTMASFCRLALGAGYLPVESYVDRDEMFSMHLLVACG